MHSNAQPTTMASTKEALDEEATSSRVDKCGGVKCPISFQRSPCPNDSLLVEAPSHEPYKGCCPPALQCQCDVAVSTFTRIPSCVGGNENAFLSVNQNGNSSFRHWRRYLQICKKPYCASGEQLTRVREGNATVPGECCDLYECRASVLR